MHLKIPSPKNLAPGALVHLKTRPWVGPAPGPRRTGALEKTLAQKTLPQKYRRASIGAAAHPPPGMSAHSELEADSAAIRSPEIHLPAPPEPQRLLPATPAPQKSSDPYTALLEPPGPMPAFQTDPQPSTVFHLQPSPGRVTVRDDNHSIQVVTYRNGHQSVSVPISPLHALTIASDLSNAATRALYRARVGEILQPSSGVTITMRVKSRILQLCRILRPHKKVNPRRFAG